MIFYKHPSCWKNYEIASLLWRLYFLWEDNGAPERHAPVEKKIQIFGQFKKKRTVLYSKSMYNKHGSHTHNQPIQPAMCTLFDYWSPPIPRLAIMTTFLIKKGRSTWSNFFESLIFLVEHSVHCTSRDFVNRLQNSNALHGDPEWPPVTNPNSILTNINIGNWTVVPLL